ncbi:hypothetical protein [Gordonia sp. (in: high G+C Gram-positive bacteria)]|uniref:hypothetical protein n=1 Tax=Gordonia sp. (in: high G+C Gram-positive bacteria) TaxID=84139 RepID=UPI003526D96F
MAKKTVVSNGDVLVDDLRRLIDSLQPEQPITDEFESREDGRDTWYRDQREHLSGWLSEYNSPGAYGRKNPSTSGKHFYNHFRCVAGLIWLAEALGEDPQVLNGAVAKVRAAPANPSSECAAFRRVVPWTRILELIEQ